MGAVSLIGILSSSTSALQDSPARQSPVWYHSTSTRSKPLAFGRMRSSLEVSPTKSPALSTSTQWQSMLKKARVWDLAEKSGYLKLALKARDVFSPRTGSSNVEMDFSVYERSDVFKRTTRRHELSKTVTEVYVGWPMNHQIVAHNEEESRIRSMNIQGETTIFDDLPHYVEQKIGEGPPRHKDWKVCENCKVHGSEKKLQACAQCLPFVIMPIYYCSKECQRTNWKLHKDECKAFANSAKHPRNSRSHPNYGIYKRVEHWHYIHRLTIRWAVVQALLRDPSINPQEVAFLVDLQIEEDPRDPPLAWPTAFRLAKEVNEGSKDRPWPEDVQDFCEYTLIFPGGPMQVPFQLGPNWRASHQQGHGIVPNWDLVLLNLCRTTPTTLKAAALQLDLLENALNFAHGTNPSAFIPLEIARKSQKNRRDPLDVNFSLSSQWLQILKEARVWESLENLGILRKLMIATDAQDPTKIPGGIAFVKNLVLE